MARPRIRRNRGWPSGRAGRFFHHASRAADLRAGRRHRRPLRLCGTGASAFNRTLHQLVLLRSLGWCARFTSGKSSRMVRRSRSCWGRTDRRAHGAIRLGTHPRPRHPGSHCSDFDQWQPRGAEGRLPQTRCFGHCHRIGRAVRRRRPDHHDRRRVWIDDRAALSFDQRGAQDAARGWGRRWNVGNVCRAGGIGAACRRTPAV